MSKSQPSADSAIAQSLQAVAQSPAEAQAALVKVETLGANMPLIRDMTQVMPVPDFVFGGGMLLLIVLLHATGMRMLTDSFERRLLKLGRLHSTWRPDVLMGLVVLLMLLLHLVEIWVWSAALVYSGLVPDWRAAGFFAANTYTTVGYGNFLLPDGWHMLAPIIAMSGLFTFGWTGSVLVEIVRRCQEVKSAAFKSRLAKSRQDDAGR
ncbi:MAG: two pore domain potassium channel family protein [Burkholderiales bacterium]|nr:two pore domain potassium channel family protein [Burkholderiales bacterium]